MKKYNQKTEAVYQKPICCVVELAHEGILCESSESQGGGNESYDNWGGYDDEGWS